MDLKQKKNLTDMLKNLPRKLSIKKTMGSLNRNMWKVQEFICQPVIPITLFFENFTLEIVWFWGWWKDLFTFKRRYDDKLFAIRRFYKIPWSRCCDRDASTVAYMIGPVNIHIWKSGKQLFLQGRKFDNSKLS